MNETVLLLNQIAALTKERDEWMRSLEFSLKQRDKLNAERDEWKARCEFSFEQRDKLTAERDALKDAARLALDALNTCETEGEQVRYSTYDTESVGSAIAALKAVL